MKTVKGWSKWIILVFLAIQLNAAEVLDNTAITELLSLGLGDSVVIEKIKTSQCNFDITLNGLKQLKASKVPDTVISAMIGKGSGHTNAAVSKRETALSVAKPNPDGLVLRKTLDYMGGVTNLWNAKYVKMNMTGKFHSILSDQVVDYAQTLYFGSPDFYRSEQPDNKRFTVIVVDGEKTPRFTGTATLTPPNRTAIANMLRFSIVKLMRDTAYEARCNIKVEPDITLKDKTYKQITMSYTNGIVFTLLLDIETGRIERLSYEFPGLNNTKVAVEIVYSKYGQIPGGLTLPHHINMYQAGKLNIDADVQTAILPNIPAACFTDPSQAVPDTQIVTETSQSAQVSQMNEENPKPVMDKNPTADDLKPQIRKLIQKSKFWIQGMGYGGDVDMTATEITILGISNHGTTLSAKASVKMKASNLGRSLNYADLYNEYTLEDTYTFEYFDTGWLITTKPHERAYDSKRYPR